MRDRDERGAEYALQDAEGDDLLEALRRGIPVPEPQTQIDGKRLTSLHGKPCAIVSRLSGGYEPDPGPAHCALAGETLARAHLAGVSFDIRQPNLRGLDWWQKTIPQVLPFLNPAQAELIQTVLAEQTRFAAGPVYDTVLALHVIEHVSEPITTLKEIARWLKPRGKLILVVPNRASVHRDVALRMAKEIRKKTLRSIGPIRLHEEAIKHFGMPQTSLGFSADLREPLYVPTRVSSN